MIGHMTSAIDNNVQLTTMKFFDKTFRRMPESLVERHWNAEPSNS